MRDIKFRGFHACDDGDTTIYVGGKAVRGEWAYGDLITGKFAEAGCFAVVSILDDSYHGIPIIVAPESIGQYTGLPDKDGREIYEGDVLTVSMPGEPGECERAIVQHGLGFWGLVWEEDLKNPDISGGPSSYTWETMQKHVTVIGTVFDAPVDKEG